MKYLQLLSKFPRNFKNPLCERAFTSPWREGLLCGSYDCRSQQRNYCEGSVPKKVNLMDFPLIVWPNILKTIKNWIYTALIIRPYLDPDFNLSSFVEGSKLAAIVVSNRLASGNFTDLEGLVTPDCLAALRKNISVLNAKQRQDLSISDGDIYFSFPYELGILFEDAQTISGAAQKRYVEITMVHHVLRGHKELMDDGEQIPFNIGVQPELRDNLFILNYRFIRDYSKGVSDQWTLNIVNHFKPIELKMD